MRRGFPLPELDNWDTGMLLNWCFEYDRLMRQKAGEVVHDDTERFRVLKEMEPEMDRMYAAGEIKEYKYQQYKATLKRCEELLSE